MKRASQMAKHRCNVRFWVRHSYNGFRTAGVMCTNMERRTHISTWEAPMTSTVTACWHLSRNTLSFSATTAAAAMHDILKPCGLGHGDVRSIITRGICECRWESQHRGHRTAIGRPSTKESFYFNTN